MNFPFPEANDHSGQKVLEYLAQLQRHNALLRESLALPQKENVLQQEQITQLKEVVEALEAEIRRLKKLPPKPDIKPITKPP